MIKISICNDTLKANRELPKHMAYSSPILIWKEGKIYNRVDYFCINNTTTLVYKPKDPLPNGSTVYIEIETELNE